MKIASSPALSPLKPQFFFFARAASFTTMLLTCAAPRAASVPLFTPRVLVPLFSPRHKRKRASFLFSRCTTRALARERDKVCSGPTEAARGPLAVFFFRGNREITALRWVVPVFSARINTRFHTSYLRSCPREKPQGRHTYKTMCIYI